MNTSQQPMANQPQETEDNYTQILVTIGSIKEQIYFMRKELERVTQDHDREIKDIKIEVVDLRIFVGKVSILSFFLAMGLPILLNALNPKIHFGDPPAAALETKGTPSQGQP